jgi:hypothetical protein
VHWIDLLLLCEEAMLIVVVLRLAWRRRGARTFSIEQQSNRDEHLGGINRAA